MAGITIAHAETQLALWLAADAAVASNQSYSISSGGGSSRQLTRADALEIRNNIEYWDKWCRRLSGTAPDGTTRSGIPVRGVIPID